jgi:hypothetical protein
MPVSSLALQDLPAAENEISDLAGGNFEAENSSLIISPVAKRGEIDSAFRVVVLNQFFLHVRNH